MDSNIVARSVENGRSLAESGGLGIPYEITVRTGRTDEDSKRVCERFALQAIARELMPGERVAGCCRYVAPHRDTVDVMYNDGEGRAHLSGVMLCDSVWMCPVCASRRAMAAREELMTVVNSPYVPMMVTFTLRHNLGETLEAVLGRLRRSFQDMLSGRIGMSLREKYAIVGSVTGLEVTYGDHGWHPHLHVIYLLAGDGGRWLYDEVNDCEVLVPSERRSFEVVVGGLMSVDFLRRWCALVARQGGYASYAGVDVTVGDTWVADYVAKYGRQPKGRPERRWGLADELAHTVRKVGRDGGLGPWQLLQLAGDGDSSSGRLFVEYAATMKGRRKLRWSKGLRALLGLQVVERGMDDLTVEDDAVARVLARLTRDQWRVVARLGVQGALLDVAVKSGGDAGVVGAYLQSLSGWPSNAVEIEDSPGVRDALFWSLGS